MAKSALRIAAVMVLTFAVIGIAQAEEEGAGKKERGERKEAPPRMSFEKMDADGNGTVSFDEYQAAMAEMLRKRFDAVDADSDGILTQDELAAGRKERRGGRERGQGQARGEGQGKGRRAPKEHAEAGE